MWACAPSLLSDMACMQLDGLGGQEPSVTPHQGIKFVLDVSGSDLQFRIGPRHTHKPLTALGGVQQPLAHRLWLCHDLALYRLTATNCARVEREPVRTEGLRRSGAPGGGRRGANVAQSDEPPRESTRHDEGIRAGQSARPRVGAGHGFGRTESGVQADSPPLSL